MNWIYDCTSDYILTVNNIIIRNIMSFTLSPRNSHKAITFLSDDTNNHNVQTFHCFLKLLYYYTV